MKTDDIKILLQRYYDGVTTEEEERQLKDFFISNEVPEEMKADKIMFMELSASATQIPEHLNEKISQTIDVRARKTRVIRLRILGGIAAMLCIIFSINAYLSRYDDVITAKDTCETPEEAAQQTQRALIAFSKALKKGQENLDKAGKTTKEAARKANKILIEQLKNLNNR